MIVPSIDLMGGETVQLVGGKERALSAGDPRPLARRFGKVGEIAVIDLDAALGRGEQGALVAELLDLARCRVGGGIRSVEAARAWLDRGAHKVILGTRATPEILSQLPRDRVIAAVDADHGEVVIKGWTERTGVALLDRLGELAPHVGGFLVTFVEREGRMGGTDLETVSRLRARLPDRVTLTVAGGITTEEELWTLDRIGAEAQLGMALYTGRLGLGAALAAPLGDAPWPAVEVDRRGIARGVLTLDLAGIEAALDDPDVLAVELDRRRRGLRLVRAAIEPGFRASGLDALHSRLSLRKAEVGPGSYTRRLLADPELLRRKLIEEAGELASAAGAADVTWEAADLAYFWMVACVRAGVELAEVEALLDRRDLALVRKPGDAKEGS